MTAHHFVLTRLSTGRLEGHALICPDARYCSVRWREAERLDRRMTDGQRWRLILGEIEGRDWPKGHVPTTSAIGRLVTREEIRGTVAIQHVSDPPIDEANALGELDAYLRAQVLP